MRIYALLAFPVVLGILSLLNQAEVRRQRRRFILFIAATFHLAITLSFHVFPLVEESPGFLLLDSVGLLFLSLTSLLFFLVSIYSWGYFHHERAIDKGGVSHFFTPCMLFFLTAMTLTSVTTHLGLLWVAIEGTTLASAPLVYYHRNVKALEATWKYLLVCSVGIALALLGLFFVAAASGGDNSNLDVASLALRGDCVEPRWLKLGFILALIGYGTKMGLAPMHAWLPDAHSEAPSPVSALLSGALLNCAFLGILRFHQVCLAAGLGSFTSRLFILFGLASLFIAAVFLFRQHDYKRMLAYSSIEHMGILALGMGVGAGFGSLLHMINHSLTKGFLFLTAGQILVAYHTKATSEVHGLLKKLPATGILFAIGSLAILGSPPFAPFISEFLIFKEGVLHQHGVTMIFYLIFLGMIFVGMSRTAFGMILGEPKDLPIEGQKPSWPMILAPGLLAIPVFLFGIYLPPPLVNLLTNAARALGGPP